MKSIRRSNYALLAGASALALTTAIPGAIAQDAETEQRTLSTVVVTTQKQSESIQDVPIAVSAFDEAALETLQLTGGPDLVRAIPNVNFTKGNFSAYNFRIRGIGVDVISTTGDAGVGVHINDVPLISNRLFEAEFFDVERVETLRGPQGTLYGRNATGGVVNVITAKPVLEEFQANAQVTLGNFDTRKFKGMINVPLGETAALRVAGSALSRSGFVDNIGTGNDIDDRDLYSIRGTLAWEPTLNLRGWILAEYFKEDDKRLRSGKQYCAKDPFRTSFGGVPIAGPDILYTSLGCRDVAIDNPAALTGVNTAATLGGGFAIIAGLANGDLNLNPQDPDRRTIEASIDPSYEAEQTFISWNVEYDLTDSLTLTYTGGYNDSEVVSQEDYNKFASSVPYNTAGIPAGNPALAPVYAGLFPGGVVNDPQLGSSNRIFTFDLSGAIGEETSHEFRLQSDFDGPFNFNAGLIKSDFETNDPSSVTESYYVFSNSLTAFAQLNNALGGALLGGTSSVDGEGNPAGDSPLDNLDGTGRNYFRSITPYELDSLALFGEAYYDVSDTLKITAGLRYTDDKKEVLRVPTFLFTPNAALPDPLAGLPVPGADGDNAGDGTFNTQFEEVTGRIGFDWSPDLSFSEDTLLYAFYSKGYKGGGINPPQPAGNANAFPQFFDPEFVNAFEVGTKNTLLDGSLQFNATGFYYDYEGYQISQIVNRTAANFNVDAEITGLEFETRWSPVSGLELSANLGILSAEVKDTFGVDVFDRTNGRTDLITIKDPGSFANCVVSAAGYTTVLALIQNGTLAPGSTGGLCGGAFAGQESTFGVGDVTYVDSNGETQTVGGLTPFDGEAKDLDGRALPGTPETTFSLAADYYWENLWNGDYEVRAHADYYRQSESFARVWNTVGDRLESWENVNLSLRLSNTSDFWFVEVFGKNVLDDDVVTGIYTTDDSSGLFRNAFLNEPGTYGITVGKSW
ncbi:MAG: TonB-dependent receptor [Pseudomonadota bacterium]